MDKPLIIKFFRYLILLDGLVILIFIMSSDYVNARLTLSHTLILFLWIMLPFYLIFFLTRKTQYIFKILFPALALVIIYFILAEEYISSDKSTAELVFITMPLFGFAGAGAGYLIYYVISKFKKTE